MISIGYRFFAGIISLLVLGGLPLSAAPADLISRTINACLTIPKDKAELIGRFEDLGWQDEKNTALSSAALSGFAARELAIALAYGEAPKARWVSSWEANLKGARGLENLILPSDGPSPRLFLTSSGGSFLQVRLRQGSYLTDVKCDLVFVQADAAQTLNQIAGSSNRPLSNLPPMTSLRGGGLEDEKVTGSYSMILFNAGKISALIDAPFEFSGNVQSLIRTQPPSR